MVVALTSVPTVWADLLDYDTPSDRFFTQANGFGGTAAPATSQQSLDNSPDAGLS